MSIAFETFLARIRPPSRKKNPACMKNTSAPASSTQTVSRAVDISDALFVVPAASAAAGMRTGTISPAAVAQANLQRFFNSNHSLSCVGQTLSPAWKRAFGKALTACTQFHCTAGVTVNRAPGSFDRCLMKMVRPGCYGEVSTP